MTTPTLATRIYDGVTIPEPGTFVIDPAHTTVGFVARHLMVSKVRGSFSEVSGSITVGEDPLASSVEATIGAASINTGVPDRDGHLRSDDFLNVEFYPNLTFRSLRVARHSGNGFAGGDQRGNFAGGDQRGNFAGGDQRGNFVLAGELTIRGVTREVELEVEFDGVVRNPWGQEVIGFTATTEIDREEFGMTWNAALESGGVLVGKKVKIEISAQAKRDA